MINRETILKAFVFKEQKEGYSLWEHRNSDLAPMPLYRVEDSWSDEEVLKHVLGYVFVAGRRVERAEIIKELQS